MLSDIIASDETRHSTILLGDYLCVLSGVSIYKYRVRYSRAYKIRTIFTQSSMITYKACYSFYYAKEIIDLIKMLQVQYQQLSKDAVTQKWRRTYYFIDVAFLMIFTIFCGLMHASFVIMVKNSPSNLNLITTKNIRFIFFVCIANFCVRKVYVTFSSIHSV